MKNLLLFSALAVLFFSCSKLNQSNLVGTWEMIEYTADGTDQMPTYTITIDFQSSNTFISYGDGTTVLYSGVYSLNESDQKLTIGSVTYDITNYQGNQMTLETTVQGSHLVYKYEKQ